MLTNLNERCKVISKKNGHGHWKIHFRIILFIIELLMLYCNIISTSIFYPSEAMIGNDWHGQNNVTGFNVHYVAAYSTCRKGAKIEHVQCALFDNRPILVLLSNCM